MSISSDIPQNDPELDQFGYASFAKLIAKATLTTPSPQGLVMAIHGPWGSGKTSFLNFMKHFLSKEFESNKPVIIDFNPWWFEDKNQLASQFLGQFSAKLKLEPSNIHLIGDKMARYSSALGNAIALSTGYPFIDKPISFFLKFFKIKPKDVFQLKREISKALYEGNQRYIFIVDDIDRLTAVEICEVFKVVKAIADFPNVVYMLSFDRDLVSKVIYDAMNFDGSAYLEKIVQLPFVLPAVTRAKLHEKLFSDLEQLIKGADLSLFEQGYWGNVFIEGIAPLISKPRDIVRYVNTLVVTFPALRNEVNITDFFALECLRINLPELYIKIRENPKWFTGTAREGLKDKNRKTEYDFHQAWANELDEKIRSNIQSMLARIFPRLDNMGQEAELLSSWRRFRRAASPEIFPCYFSFTIDPNQLSRAEIIGLINELNDKEKTKKTLLDAIKNKRLDGSSKAKDYLTQLRDFDTEIDQERATNLLCVIGQIADSLIIKSDEIGSFFGISNSWNTIWVIQHLLRLIPEQERDTQLVKIFSEGNSIAILFEIITSIQYSKKNNTEHGPSAVLTSISLDTVNKLKEIFLEKINQSIADKRLLLVPRLQYVIAYWREWAGPEAPQAWAESLMKNKLIFIKFMTYYISQSRTTAIGDHIGEINYSFNFELFSGIFNVKNVMDLLKDIGPDDWLNEEEKRALDMFIQKYEEDYNE